MTEKKLSFAITGPDGSGKSTVGNLLKTHILRKQPDTVIYKGYRPASITKEGESTLKFEWVTKIIELLHKLGDRTKNRRLISLANSVQVLYVSRLLEPFLKNKYDPDITFHSRDILRIDPAVYGEMYSGLISKLEPKERLQFLSSLTGESYRDFIFFLNTDPQVGLERIIRRMEEEAGRELDADERKKFQHMHENIPGLQKLNELYLKIIKEVLILHPETPIFEIPTGDLSKEEVMQVMYEVIEVWLESDSSWQGWFLYSSITGQFDIKD